MSHFQKLLVLLAFSLFPVASFCQQPLTWQQVRDKFEAVNPTLKVAQISIDESRANETTAYLRPNPNLSVLADGTQLVPHQGVWQPLVGTDYSPNVTTCMKGGTSGNCGWKAPRKPPISLAHNLRIRTGRFFPLCVALSC
jgi:hypothetical protein